MKSSRESTQQIWPFWRSKTRNLHLDQPSILTKSILFKEAKTQLLWGRCIYQTLKKLRKRPSSGKRLLLLWETTLTGQKMNLCRPILAMKSSIKTTNTNFAWHLHRRLLSTNRLSLEKTSTWSIRCRYKLSLASMLKLTGSNINKRSETFRPTLMKTSCKLTSRLPRSGPRTSIKSTKNSQTNVILQLRQSSTAQFLPSPWGTLFVS